MITYQPFKSGHLRFLVPQASQRYDHAVLLQPEYAQIIDANFALSAWSGFVCVAAAGCIPVFPTRAIAWAVLSNDAAPFMLAITRKVRRVMAGLPYQRIEIAVRADFEDGKRFARLIGMKLETPEPMRKHGADGVDEYQYAMVKP